MKTLVGLVVVLILVSLLVWSVRRDDSFMSRFTNNSETVEIDDETDEVFGENFGSTPHQEQLLTCTPELFAADCTTVPKEKICSSETAYAEDGTQTRTETEYISACHYCKLFGANQTMEFGNERVESRGYTLGACSN